MLRRTSLSTGILITTAVLLFSVWQYTGNGQNPEKARIYQPEKNKHSTRLISKAVNDLGNPSGLLLFYLESIAHSVTWTLVP